MLFSDPFPPLSFFISVFFFSFALRFPPLSTPSTSKPNRYILITNIDHILPHVNNNTDALYKSVITSATVFIQKAYRAHRARRAKDKGADMGDDDNGGERTVTIKYKVNDKDKDVFSITNKDRSAEETHKNTPKPQRKRQTPKRPKQLNA